MLKTYPPLTVRPLTLRGVFGITNKLLRRRTGALIGYYALYFLFALLLMAPGVLAMVFSGLALDQDPSAFSSSFSASGAEAFSLITGFLGSMFLLFLASLVLSLVFTPIASGTVYSEMTARIYGQASSLGQMLRRSKYALKRFFTTTLCNMVAAWGISFAVSLVTGLLVGVVMVFALFGSVFAIMEGNTPLGTGAIIALVCIYLLVLAVSVAASSLLSFVFPAAVNEPVKNFAAVGRSIKLVWKRLGRVVGCMFILCGITLAVALLFVAAMTASEFLPTAAAVIVIVLALVLYIGLIIFLSLYQPAMLTVLYFDARSRLEGTSFPPVVNAAPVCNAQPVVNAAPVADPTIVVSAQPTVEAAPAADVVPSVSITLDLPTAPEQETESQEN